MALVLYTERRRHSDDLIWSLPNQYHSCVCLSIAYFYFKNLPPKSLHKFHQKRHFFRKWSLQYGYNLSYTFRRCEGRSQKLEVDFIISNYLEYLFLSPAEDFMRGSESISLPYIPKCYSPTGAPCLTHSEQTYVSKNETGTESGDWISLQVLI